MAKSTVGMPKDDMMGFTVFKPERKSNCQTNKEIYFTLTSVGVSFSVKAVEVMGNPEATVVLFDMQDRMLVVPSKLSNQNAMYLACAGGPRKRNQLKIKSLGTEILHRINGNEYSEFKGIIRCFGKKIERVDGNALLFDLSGICKEKK